MFAGFLLSLREGLEAALIIGIVLGVLRKLKRPDLNGVVWSGVGVAAALSLLAAGVLSWVILWMQNHGSSPKSEIEEQTNQATLGEWSKGIICAGVPGSVP